MNKSALAFFAHIATRGLAVARNFSDADVLAFGYDAHQIAFFEVAHNLRYAYGKQAASLDRKSVV